jgi:hypothetical protein
VKRGEPLKRGKPLKRTQISRTGEKPLRSDPAKVWDWANRSNHPLPQRSKKRIDETPDRQQLVREMLAEFPGCAAGIPYFCQRWSSEVNEIVRRGQWDGGFLVKENCETLCHNCHTWITTHPDWAEHHGHQIKGAGRELRGDVDEDLVREARGIRARASYRCDVDCEVDHRAG